LSTEGSELLAPPAGACSLRHWFPQPCWQPARRAVEWSWVKLASACSLCFVPVPTKGPRAARAQLSSFHLPSRGRHDQGAATLSPFQSVLQGNFEHCPFVLFAIYVCFSRVSPPPHANLVGSNRVSWFQVVCFREGVLSCS